MQELNRSRFEEKIDRYVAALVGFFSRPDDNPTIAVEFFKIGMMCGFFAIVGIAEIIYRSFQ